MDLPLKLISLRKEAGLTQIDLAEKLNVSRQAISKWEVGTAVPGTDKPKDLSELYGVPVDYLLNDDADMPLKGDENQTKQTEDLTFITKTVKHIGILLGAMSVLMIALLVAILLCVAKIHGSEQSEAVSITDLSCDQNPNGYPVETVHLIPMG